MFFGTAVITKGKNNADKGPQTVQMRTQNKQAHVSFKLGQIQFMMPNSCGPEEADDILFYIRPSSTTALSLFNVELSVPSHAFNRLSYDLLSY